MCEYTLRWIEHKGYNIKKKPPSFESTAISE